LGEKSTSAFFFQVIHPDAVSGGAFGKGRTQSENITAVLRDILGHGNESCMVPGQLEANWATRCATSGGLLFSEAEIKEFGILAAECGHEAGEWDPGSFVAES